MAILDELLKKKNKEVKLVDIKLKIPVELKDKLDYICKSTGVNKDEYLTKIFERSEIARVYNELKKQDSKEE